MANQLIILPEGRASIRWHLITDAVPYGGVIDHGLLDMQNVDVPLVKYSKITPQFGSRVICNLFAHN